MATLVVHCSVLDPAQRIPVRHAYRRVSGGANVSVPLRWSPPPGGTRSIVITMIDLHPIARFWVHWCVAGLPPDVLEVPEGASLNPRLMPAGVIETINGFGEPGYGGPAPPGGSGPHDYVLTVHACSGFPAITRAPLSKKQIDELLAGLVLASGSCTGIFERR